MPCWEWYIAREESASAFCVTKSFDISLNISCQTDSSLSSGSSIEACIKWQKRTKCWNNQVAKIIQGRFSCGSDFNFLQWNRFCYLPIPIKKFRNFIKKNSKNRLRKNKLFDYNRTQMFDLKIQIVFILDVPVFEWRWCLSSILNQTRDYE